MHKDFPGNLFIKIITVWKVFLSNREFHDKLQREFTQA